MPAAANVASRRCALIYSRGSIFVTTATTAAVRREG